jgi:hypothetical protein
MEPAKTRYKRRTLLEDIKARPTSQPSMRLPAEVMDLVVELFFEDRDRRLRKPEMG